MSAFPALVNRIPPGLLRLLGLQNTGRNPNQLAEFYQPVLEMRDWIFSQQANWLVDNFNAGIAANGQYDPLTNAMQVPSGEWWYVLDGGVRIQMNAASSCAVSAYWLVPNTGTGNTEVFSTNPERVTQNEHITIPMQVRAGMFLPPLSRPQARLSNITGTGTGNFFVTVVRLPG